MNRVQHYLVLGGARVLYASTGRLMAIKFISTLSASADVLALASLEVDLTQIPVGQSMTVKWRGKPVFIRHRRPEEIARAEKENADEMRDHQLDSARYKEGKPQWLVMLGICTHLGCVPIGEAGDYAVSYFHFFARIRISVCLSPTSFSSYSLSHIPSSPSIRQTN